MGKMLLIIGGSSDIALDYIRNYHFRYDTIVATYYTHKNLLDELIENTKLSCRLIPYRINLHEEHAVDDLLNFLNEQALLPQYVIFLSASKVVNSRLEDMNLQDVESEFSLETYPFLN